ncbi:hypothetical protein MAH1_13530 [Sessilibacter sp. MAH1]
MVGMLRKIINKKSLLACSISVAALTLGACSSGGGGGNSGSSTPVSVFGEAAKGIVINGVVTVYPITGGDIDTNTVLGTGVTDSTGSYDSIELTNYSGGPVAVRITAASDGSTMMRCDLSAGCGTGIAFGDDFPLEDFELDAVLPEVTANTVSVAVTPLTTVASQLALANFAMGTETDILAAINNANTSVANRFGLSGSVTEFDVVDVTNPADVASAEQSSLQYNLYNAAIVQAILSDNSGVSIAQAVQAFANQYVDNGGLADTEIDGAPGITLEDVLLGASVVIDSVQMLLADAGLNVDLGSLETAIDTQAMIAGNGSTDPTDGTPDDSVDATELQLAKDAVSDVRTLVTSFDVTSFNTFADELSLAGDAISDGTLQSLEALSLASQAIARAVEFIELQQSTDSQYVDLITGITVAISEDTYTVDEDVVVLVDDFTEVSVPVSLEAVASNITLTETIGQTTNDGGAIDSMDTVDPSVSTSDSITTEVDVTLDVSGSAGVAGVVSVSITGGTANVALTITDTDAGLVSEDLGDGTTLSGAGLESQYEATNVGLSLDVEIAQLTLDNPVTFEGSISFDSNEITGSDSEFLGAIVDSSDSTGLAFITEFSESLAVGQVTLALSGEFANASGESLTASLTVNGDATGLLFSCVETESVDLATGVLTLSEDCLGETEDSFVDVTFGLGFVLDLDGVLSDVSVLLVGERTGLDTATTTAAISYDEVQLQFGLDLTTLTTAPSEITIVNQDDVEITLAEDLDGVISGSISLNGTVYGLIEENDNGLVTINYIDGVFESL